MSVRTKGRRKITVNNKLYIWNVAWDYDGLNLILNIVANDKSIMLCYRSLNRKESYIFSFGTTFQNKKTKINSYHKYLLPFEVPEIITPKFVAQLILWAEHGDNAVEVSC